MASLWENVRGAAGGGISGLGSALHLPEMGISENIMGKPTPQAMQALETESSRLGTLKSAGQIQGATIGPTMNVNTPAAPGVSGGGGSSSYLADIDAAYNANLQALSNQAGETQAQYGLAQSGLSSQYGEARANVGETQKAQIGQLGESAQTVGTSSQSAIQQARQAYGELQQRNQAYLSAQGISSSSAAEAMQEGLSRNTLNALNNIAQNRDLTLQNIEKEKTKTNDFYQRQLTNLDTGLAQAQKEIDLQLNSALNRITEARTMAANQKQQAKNSIIAQAQQAYQAASAQTAQYQQALDSWTQTKNQILTISGQHTTGDIGYQQLLAGMAQANQKLASSGIQIDTGAFLNSLTNPYAAAQGTSYFVGTTAPKGKLETINGKQVWVDEAGNIVKQY
jgi:hypothetical protein